MFKKLWAQTNGIYHFKANPAVQGRCFRVASQQTSRVCTLAYTIVSLANSGSDSGPFSALHGACTRARSMQPTDRFGSQQRPSRKTGLRLSGWHAGRAPKTPLVVWPAVVNHHSPSRCWSQVVRLSVDGCFVKKSEERVQRIRYTESMAPSRLKGFCSSSGESRTCFQLH